MTATAMTRQTRQGKRSRRGAAQPDYCLLLAVSVLVGLGIVMVASSSFSIAERQLGQPFYYLSRQLFYVSIGLMAAVLVSRIPLARWERVGGTLLLISLAMLVLVLIPGVGREVNGSMRWLSLGVFNLQPSELVKFFVVIYLAGYLVRHHDEVRSAVSGFIKPMVLLALLCVLLLAEPDFGAAAVMLMTAMVMMYLAGVRVWQFGVLMGLVSLAMAILAISSPYRLQRITAFIDPWADPFASGFQLTQALIAFGRGEWFGVGLGSSIQKLFYLPEAHTDFLFAVMAEEMGLLISLTVIALFALIVHRAFVMGRRAERAGLKFAAYLAYGLGIWIGLQAFTNIGVNMGVLPTKGLTLPLMSYGGSSLIVMLAVIGLLWRVNLESQQPSVATTEQSVKRRYSSQKARGGRSW